MREDVAATRARLLERWRATRSPKLATILEMLDRQAPDDLPARLEALVTPRVATTLERVHAVASIDDPRVSKWAIGALERLPFTTPSAWALLETCIEIVRFRRDVRVLPSAVAIREGIRTRIGRLTVREALLARLDDVVAQVSEVVPLEPTAEEFELERRLAPLLGAETNEAALLADVYANPIDDAPRLVYADWLLERGEPRGELIMLQFNRRSGAQTPAEAAREKELLKKHGKAWLGALAPVLSFGRYSNTTFERGFVSTAGIILSVGKKMEPLWNAPEWSTVENLEGPWPRELLHLAPLRGLQILPDLSDDQLRKLLAADKKLPVTTLSLFGPLWGWANLAKVFPRLERLTMWLDRTPTMKDIVDLASTGIRYLRFNRTFNAPKEPAIDDEVLALCLELETSTLPLEEIAITGRWVQGGRPEPIVLHRKTNGFG